MDEVLKRIESLLPRKPDGSLVHGCKKELTDFLGLPSNTMAEWLSGRNRSYRNYIARVAEFYGVSANWILGIGETDEIKKDPSVMSDEEVDAELYEILTELKDRPEMRALFRAAKGTNADNVRRVADMLEGFKSK